MMMFVTYAQKNIHADLSYTGEPFAAFKSGTIIAFLDSLMNSVLYCDRFDELSADMYKTLDAESRLSDMPRDALDVAKRIFRLRFSLKIQKYDRNHQYYLAAIDDKTNMEVLRREAIMDLAFADDFGF